MIEMKENKVYKLSNNKSYAIIKKANLNKKDYYIASKLEDKDDAIVILTAEGDNVVFVTDPILLKELANIVSADLKKLIEKKTAKKASKATKLK